MMKLQQGSWLFADFKSSPQASDISNFPLGKAESSATELQHAIAKLDLKGQTLVF